jgi:hypothetical protein
MRSRCSLSVCVPHPIVARQRLGKNPHNFLCDYEITLLSVCPNNSFVFYAVGLRVGLDALEKRNFPAAAGNLTPTCGMNYHEIMFP